MQHINNANGDVGKEGLITPRPSDNKAVFNLHKLDDTTLWRVYCSLPEDERPAKRPARAAQPRPVKKSKGGKKPAIKGPMAALQQPVVIEEDVVCDAATAATSGAACRASPTRPSCPRRGTARCTDGITCDTCEEEMDADEKWGGDTHGVKYEQPEAEETDADSRPPAARRRHRHRRLRGGGCRRRQPLWLRRRRRLFQARHPMQN